ncbi:MAG: dihydrofolate reductase family protein [Microbacteriaceae bacterium]|nr:dihydrofolate reductase family protein [Microbacteriaceae bacterium]
MGHVIYDAAATLNGFLADEQGSLDWLLSVAGADEAATELVPTGATVLVEGSATYQWVLDHEDLLAQPEKWPALYGSKPTFVFTSRELPVPAGADVRLRSGSVSETFSEIRATAGEGDIWIVGGGDPAGQFIDAGLVDRIAVSVAPAAVVGGAPLLPRTYGPDRLELLSADAVGQFARLVYAVRRG